MEPLDPKDIEASRHFIVTVAVTLLILAAAAAGITYLVISR